MVDRAIHNLGYGVTHLRYHRKYGKFICEQYRTSCSFPEKAFRGVVQEMMDISSDTIIDH